ncbi:MAG: xanthine dehydrogenase YagR molybdenum-binding subunit [Pseudonocardiales bacterium]|jgi:xanthine dehydrogenase YagR molybdenum-binding subunit|nr:xanthine dehydrogenase YagR molybdenum-binding subunit [Pseudonocardiales bacterium]
MTSTLDPATTRTPLMGQGINRIDAIAKVTGEARYSGEYPLDGMIYGWVVQAPIAKGRISDIRPATTLSMPGVLAVLDYRNAPRLSDAGDGELLLLQGDRVYYRGEAVAVVLAQSLEQARAGADALDVSYLAESHDVLFRADHPDMYTPELVNPNFPSASNVGDVDAALAAAEVVIDQVYATPAEHNNPMEPHATTAHWDGDTLLVFDSNQGASSVQMSLCRLFDLPRSAVQVKSEHVGGGFGAKGSARPPVVLASMAARLLGRPVRVTLTRQQMFAMVGYRTPTIQQVRLGSDRSGRLQALDHLAYSQTSKILEFAEQTAVLSRMMYATPNLRTAHRLLPLDVPTPRWMRAPGEAPGSFALESAMDELAQACNVDPVELRIRNEPDLEPDSGRPFSSRNLVACLREGARRFGWDDRDRRPAIRQDGRWLMGSGMASSTYPARNAPSTCQVQARSDGTFEVRITASDIGTGARTALTQIAADALQVELDRVELRIGDSDFGPAMIAGGSMGTASWSWAVVKACRDLLGQLDAHSGAVPAGGLLARADTKDDVAAQADVTRHAFGAQFVEVAVDIRTGEVRVPRMIGVFAAGHIVNARTARSQLIGGMIMGLGMALLEESLMDLRFGDYLNHDLAGYHVASNADVRSIEVSWIDEQDDQTNPSGIKGIGEIGIVGTAAAIANAVWHATGRRQRTLPIRPDRVIS